MARGKGRRQVQNQKSCRGNGMMLRNDPEAGLKVNAVGENRVPDAEQAEQ